MYHLEKKSYERAPANKSAKYLSMEKKRMIVIHTIHLCLSRTGHGSTLRDALGMICGQILKNGKTIANKESKDNRNSLQHTPVNSRRGSRSSMPFSPEDIDDFQGSGAPSPNESEQSFGMMESPLKKRRNTGAATPGNPHVQQSATSFKQVWKKKVRVSRFLLQLMVQMNHDSSHHRDCLENFIQKFLQIEKDSSELVEVGEHTNKKKSDFFEDFDHLLQIQDSSSNGEKTFNMRGLSSKVTNLKYSEEENNKEEQTEFFRGGEDNPTAGSMQSSEISFPIGIGSSSSSQQNYNKFNKDQMKEPFYSYKALFSSFLQDCSDLHVEIPVGMSVEIVGDR